MKNISIVIPVFNEEETINELYREIRSVVEANNYQYEVIYVNDGSSDSTEAVLESLHVADPSHVKVINFDKNYGKALGLKAGFALAQGNIIFTMDGDLQDDPHEIPRFIAMIESGYDLVSGWKYDRKDSFVKNKTSKIYNAANSITSGVYLHDHNCGFKAYRSEVAKALPLYGQLHRYTPMLASASGYDAITEIKVNHRKRTHGVSKYGISRFIYGITGLMHAHSLARKIKLEQQDRVMIPTYGFKNILA